MSFARGQSVLCHGQHAISIASRGTGRRTFSRSTALQKYGPVPKFTEVSNTELQSLLDTLRKKCIMPAHLAANQRALIFKPSNKKQLEAEPVTVNLSGEEFVLEHLGKFKGVPKLKRSLRRAAELMEGKDWDNLPNLLKGLKNAGFQPETAMNLAEFRFLINRAGVADRMDVILECVRRAADTGMVLRHTEIVRQILHQLHLKALSKDQTLDDINQTLSWAEQIVTQMEETKHAGLSSPWSSDNPRSSPLIIGLMLNISALRSSRYLNHRDEDGKVLDYANKLLGARPVKILTFEERQLLNPDKRGINAVTNEESHLLGSIRENLPVIHGMKLALTILKPTSPVAGRLQEQIEKLEPQLAAQQETASQILQAKDSGKARNQTLLYYDSLVGSETL